jgi:type 1 glutamine amidotransferase
MKKFFKIIGWTILSIILMLSVAMGTFMYKVKYGFPVSYETEMPAIQFPAGQKAILVFTKTTGFRHAESIDASIPMLKDLGKKHQYFVYETADGGVFNAQQLKQFSLVIFDNSTGRVLNDEQQTALEKYVEEGGSLMGIHGAGDDSHRWDWYEKNLLGAKFSHHPLNPQFQQADVRMSENVDTLFSKNLAKQWSNTDEWYVFLNQPKDMQILYSINGDMIIPNGNMLWISDKNFGMGANHPVAWYRMVGKGKTFYTSMGHSAAVWQNPNYLKLIEQGVTWSIQKN